MTSKDYLETLTAQLKSFNKIAVGELCAKLIEHLYSSDEEFSSSDAEKIMQRLRNKRMFLWMQKIGDVLILTGRHTYKIRRQFAQALIDQNNLTAALSVLKELASDTSNAPDDNTEAKFENSEARGLLGRVHKQFYINANSPNTPRSIQHISEAIKFYLDVYTSDPEERIWHGINVVALLKRAIADQVDLTGFPSADKLATSILQTIQKKDDDHKADAWDFATAAEACLALNKPEEALEWLSGYARMPYCDAFELASTLRQLEEVWQLDLSSAAGKLLLPLLKAELLKREGGSVTLTVAEVQSLKANENLIDSNYDSMPKPSIGGNGAIKLEKVFGDDSFKTYSWYMRGADRCLTIARIGREATKGFGTGFLLKGFALHESLGDELVILTNAHVVSNTDKALRPDQAVIIFEVLDRDEEFRISEIIWSSPVNELDASILRFTSASRKRVEQLIPDAKIYPVSTHLPELDNSERVYIIGHPFGGTLQLSFQDNVLLDYEDPKIHYRTPTEGGSSGSPVFNQQWDLVGLHHAGSKEMPCLNKKPGTYEANEGIWIQSIRNKFESDLKKKSSKVDSN